jgi:ribosomal protein L11 methyltransferase
MTKNPETWLALEIKVDSEAMEAVEFALNELDALGTEINHLGKKQTETVCIVGYFNEKQPDEIVQAQIEEALRIYDFENNAVKETSWREVENKDWLEEWKKHWQPTKTGKFIVAPTWSEIDANENNENQQNREIVIRIDPEMAFGTGTHETTRLCLQAIEENYTREQTFLDVGTGTGILAIAAAKLKVQSFRFKVQSYKSEFQNLPVENERTLNFEPKTLNRILACDTDENSIVIAKKNAELNHVRDAIDFYAGSISEETLAFDFVCANLTADVILPLLPLLVEKARKKLVLSGILKTQESSIAEKLRELKISDFKVQTDGEWISIIVDNE